MSDQRIAKDKLVEFKYSILDPQGTVVEQVDIPVSYVHGSDSGIWDKVEAALEGHGEGDRIEVDLSPEEGFGPTQEELTFTDRIENVPEQFRYVRAEVEMQNDRGEIKTFVVSKIEDGMLTVDGNHPLAGKPLRFVIDIVAIRDATPDEIRQGRPEGSSPIH